MILTSGRQWICRAAGDDTISSSTNLNTDYTFNVRYCEAFWAATTANKVSVETSLPAFEIFPDSNFHPILVLVGRSNVVVGTVTLQ